MFQTTNQWSFFFHHDLLVKQLMPLAPRHVASRRFRVSGKRAMINSSHPKKPMSIIIEAGIQFIYIIYFMDGPGYGWSWFWCPSGFRIEKLSVSGCVPPLRRTACSQGLLRYLIGCVNGLGKTKYGILKVDGQKPKLLTSWGEEHKNSMVSNLGFKPRSLVFPIQIAEPTAEARLPTYRLHIAWQVGLCEIFQVNQWFDMFDCFGGCLKENSSVNHQFWEFPTIPSIQIYRIKVFWMATNEDKPILG